MTKPKLPFHRVLPAMVLLSALLFALNARANVIDSLKSVVAHQPDSPEKVAKLMELSRLYITINPDSTISYSKRAYALSEKINFSEGLIDPLFHISTAFRNQGLFDSARIYNEKFLAIALSMHDSLRMARGYYAQTFIHFGKSEYLLARENIEKSMAFFKGLNHQLGILGCYNATARIFSRQLLLDSSVYYYHKAIEVAEASGEFQTLGTIYDNLSQLYVELNQVGNAERMALQSLEINKKYNQSAMMGNNYNVLANCAVLKGDYNQAMKYYDISDSMYSALGTRISLADNQFNRGFVYLKQKKYDLAMDYYRRGLRAYRELGDIRGEMVSFGSIASVYSLTGHYEKAQQLHDSCLVLARMLGETKYVIQSLGNKSDTYKEAGNYKLAFEYLIKQYDFKDSIYTLEKDRVINELTLRYEKKQDQARILELDNANLEKDLSLRRRTSQRNAYMFAALAVLTAGFFLVLYYRQRAAKDRIIAAQMIRQLEEEKMLMAAKSLVEGQEEERKRIARDLHDGLGVLLSATKLQFTTLKDNSPENSEVIEKATRLLEQASGDVRKISHNMMPGLLTRMGLYEAVEDLFENINDKGELSARCHIHDDPPRLPENREIMLYRIIQELVNNTLKHARARNIMLDIRQSNGNIDLQYSDDGCGFDASQVKSSASMGLNSIRSRMSFLDGNIEIESQPGHGARFYITVPV